MGRELKVPNELAGHPSERDDAIGIEIVSRPYLALELWRRISDAPVEQIQLGVIAAGNPCRSPARAPGVVRPCLMSRLTGGRDRVETPTLLAGFGIVSA